MCAALDTIELAPPVRDSVGFSALVFASCLVVLSLATFFFIRAAWQDEAALLVLSAYLALMWLAMAASGARTFLVRRTWCIDASGLTRRERLLWFTWHKPIVGITAFELIHGVWSDQKGFTDRLQCLAAGRPVQLDLVMRTANRSGRQSDPRGFLSRRVPRWTVVGHVRPSPGIPTLGEAEVARLDPAARLIDEHLVAVAVLFAKRCRVPLIFEVAEVAAP